MINMIHEKEQYIPEISRRDVKRSRKQESMLDFCKSLLYKISFDYKLLNKEYYKCMDYLNKEEQMQLRDWISCQEFSKWIIPFPHKNKNTG